MTYRELLKICIERPGCLNTKEQNKIETNMRFQMWMDQENDDNFQLEGKDGRA